MLPCGVPAGLLAENNDYEIKADLGGKSLPADWDVALNDVPLDKVFRKGLSVFPFKIGFFAGDLRVSVLDGSKVVAEVGLEVDPAAAKLTRDEYAAMIADIARSTLALYRLGDVTLPAETTPSAIRSDLVTLDLVRTNFCAFDRAVSRIADQPIRVLKSIDVNVGVFNARRVSDRAIGAALRSGRSRLATRDEALAAPRLVAALGGLLTPTIVEARRTDRTDAYENRALLGFMRWLDLVLADLSRRLSAGVSEIGAAATALWLHRLASWRSRLASLTKRDLFADLDPDPALHSTSVFRMHPDYASAFSAMVRMKAGLGTGSAVAPSIPIDKTYVLYEIWCYVGLLLAVAEAFPEAHPHVCKLLRGCQAPNDLGTVLAGGTDSEISLGGGLTLTYQRRFGPIPANDGSRALVVEAIPDITLARTDSHGQCKRLVILDPKYRTDRALADGLRDMHVYRDAIVNDAGERLVAAAIAIAPRPGKFPRAEPKFPTNAPAVLKACPGGDPLLFRNILEMAVAALS